jgi:hypothetical protein
MCTISSRGTFQKPSPTRGWSLVTFLFCSAPTTAPVASSYLDRTHTHADAGDEATSVISLSGR